MTPYENATDEPKRIEPKLSALENQLLGYIIAKAGWEQAKKDWPILLCPQWIVPGSSGVTDLDPNLEMRIGQRPKE